MSKNSNWTRDETIIAFNIYCKIPFRKSNKNNPEIIKYANILGRSPSALNMKIGNFGRLDPALKSQGIVGLVNGSKLEEEVWSEFNGNWEKLAFESEALIAQRQSQDINLFCELDLHDFPDGKERLTLVKTRVNQSFFRSAILSSYNSRCCITGLSIPDFLVASHIMPWAVDTENRINPHNGLCLNSIHDVAFDKGFIAITPDYNVVVSDFFKRQSDDTMVNEFFMKYQGRRIHLPDRFLPSREFLDYHYQNVFKQA